MNVFACLFQFLEKVLKYLDDWRAKAESTVGMSKEEQAKLCLSRQTDFGWHITSEYFYKIPEIRGLKILLVYRKSTAQANFQDFELPPFLIKRLSFRMYRGFQIN